MLAFQVVSLYVKPNSTSSEVCIFTLIYFEIYRISELEGSLDVAHKDLIKSEEIKSHLQKECQEVNYSDSIYRTLLVFAENGKRVTHMAECVRYTSLEANHPACNFKFCSFFFISSSFKYLYIT